MKIKNKLSQFASLKNRAFLATSAVLCVSFSLTNVEGFAPAGLARTVPSTGFAPSTMTTHTTFRAMNKMEGEEKDNLHDNTHHTSVDSTPSKIPAVEKATNKVSNTQMGATAVTAALAMLLAFSPLTANAAMTGGRMGGSFSAAPTRSLSVPSRSYGGGYSPTRSLSVPSRSYGGGYSSSSQSRYSSRPSVTVAPTSSPEVSSIYGAIIFELLLYLSGLCIIFWDDIRSFAAGVDVTLNDFLSSWTKSAATSALGSGTSVMQISVAMQVPNRDDLNSILSVLNRLSQTAKTDSRIGIQNLTSQVALELLRRKSSIISASSCYKHFSSRDKAQREFNGLSVKERGKFEQETVSKYGGVDYSSPVSRLVDPAGNQETVAVMTLLLSIDGDSTKVPKIKTIQDVEEALRKIASDAMVDDCLQAAEILWTPEDRSETLTLHDVIADYPELRSV